jgi:tRNA uridine 5-carboxymethylaminomethyl modification enzyme
MISDEEWSAFKRRKKLVEEVIKILKEVRIDPGDFNQIALMFGLPELTEKVVAISYLKRPEVSISVLYEYLAKKFDLPTLELDVEIFDTIDAEIKYEGYAERQKRLADTLKRVQSMPIPKGIDYAKVPNISYRSRAILETYRPRTVEEAARLPNISFSDVLSLITYLEFEAWNKKESWSRG